MNNRIREFRTSRGWSLQRLAEEAGTSKGQVDKLEKGARRLTSDWMVRLAKALNCDPRDFFPQAPVLAAPKMRKTRAANANAALIPVRNAAGKLVDHVPRPYYLAHVNEAWALAFTDDAMQPMYRPRQLLFVNPYRAPASGSGVVIVPRKGEARVREFVASDAKSVTLREYHPKKREIAVMLRDIEAIQAVVGTVEG